MIKYIKSVLWNVAKRLSYIEDARCLKVKMLVPIYCIQVPFLVSLYSMLVTGNLSCHLMAL